MSTAIAFRLNGEDRVLPSGTSPAATLLDWLRGPAGLRGTKEGCAEGDCGACTVALEEPDGSRVPVNACLMLLGQAHGRALRTVEGLAGPDGTPHPAQRLLAAEGGTQCGFCTPGIAVTAWTHAREGGDPHEALAGNLCRCTGYRPILDAFAGLADDGEISAPAPAPPPGPLEGDGQVFHRPRSLAELVALRTARPDAWLLAGGTDLGLRVAEHRERPAEIISVLEVPELRSLAIFPDGMRVGAALPYRVLLARAAAEPGYAPLAGLLRRLGSRQVRGLGTLGGNLGTASPIGDALPPLLALGAAVRVAGPAGERDVPAEAFLLGYRRNALGRDEVVRDAWLPRPGPDAMLFCEKLSRRHDQDIAAVGLSALIRVADGRVVEARVAHGGLGPAAARSAGAEGALLGAAWGRAALDRAAEALFEEVRPLSDSRGSDEYRRVAAANLVRRLWWRANPAGVAA